MEKLQQIMDNIKEWSDATFGEMQRTPGMVAHLKKEVDELAKEVAQNDNELGIQIELADCLMLLLDVASHSGIDAESLLFEVEHKLGINKIRKWGEPNTNGSIEHIKSNNK